MNTRNALPILALLSLPQSALAQSVTIAKATPVDVVEALKMQLLPQGFQFVSANERSALFALDRGMVPQQGNQIVRGAILHVVLEFTARFKQKKEGLQVTASEEVVGDPRSSVQFRKPVESEAERRSMQQLLDTIRADLEGRPTADSATRRDSTRP